MFGPSVVEEPEKRAALAQELASQRGQSVFGKLVTEASIGQQIGYAEAMAAAPVPPTPMPTLVTPLPPRSLLAGLSIAEAIEALAKNPQYHGVITEAEKLRPDGIRPEVHDAVQAARAAVGLEPLTADLTLVPLDAVPPEGLTDEQVARMFEVSGMKKAELQEALVKAKIAFETDANKATLVKLLLEAEGLPNVPGADE